MREMFNNENNNENTLDKDENNSNETVQVRDGLKDNKVTISKLDCALYCILFICIGVFLSSAYWGHYMRSTKPYLLNDKISNMLSDYYGDADIDDKKLEDLYIKSVAQALGDKYTFYSFGEQADKMQEQMNGKFCGIGVRVTPDQKGILVTEVMENSPSEKVGLQAGDIIFKINGEYVVIDSYESYTASVETLKGEAGTQVNIEVYRDKTGETCGFEITREEIEAQDVTYKNIGDYGYIRISTFSDNTAKQFASCVNKSQKNGDSGIVLDLRNNTGGLLESVVNVANELMDNKTLITQKYKSGKEKSIKLENGKSYNNNIVVIVNELTASASEILAGSLRDNIGCKIVGKTTYGKGIICTYKEYDDGSVSCVSSGEYILPNGESINEIGIKPDYEVEFDYNKCNNIYMVDTENDDQLAKAIDAISNQ